MSGPVKKWTKQRIIDKAIQAHGERQRRERYAEPDPTRTTLSDETSSKASAELSVVKAHASGEIGGVTSKAGPSGSGSRYASEERPQPQHVGASSADGRRTQAITTLDESYPEEGLIDDEVLKGDGCEASGVESVGAVVTGRAEGTGVVATGDAHPGELDKGVENEGEHSAEFREIGEQLETRVANSRPN